MTRLDSIEQDGRFRAKKIIIVFIVLLFVTAGYFFFRRLQTPKDSTLTNITSNASSSFEKYPDLAKWERPDGPIRVGLQVGHWKNNELPDELSNIKNNGGTSGGGFPEWEVNMNIAQDAKQLLEEKGVVVDLLPATIPPGYFADAFVAIHADGSIDHSVSGFKVASPRRDISGKASELQQIINDTYRQVTGLPQDSNITRNMMGYYAFSWRRFDHSLHPMTPATILETGFLTNPGEAKLLTKSPSIPAEAIADALLKFLRIT